MNKRVGCWFTYLMIIIWGIIYVLNLKFNVADRLMNVGIFKIGNEFYRLGTALLVHQKFLHVFANALALFFIGRYLEPQIASWKLLLFSVVIGMITNGIFSCIYRNAVSVGGSPINFALIGMILALHITHTDCLEFKLGTWYGNWIMFYVVFANVPLFSTSFLSTILIHSVAAVMGILLGCVCIALKLL